MSKKYDHGDLYESIYKKRRDFVEFLMRNEGIKPNKEDLFLAAHGGDFNIIDLVMNYAKFDIESAVDSKRFQKGVEPRVIVYILNKVVKKQNEEENV